VVWTRPPFCADAANFLVGDATEVGGLDAPAFMCTAVCCLCDAKTSAPTALDTCERDGKISRGEI
jgi:hypothetical protein